jgi:hypothetical protein
VAAASSPGSIAAVTSSSQALPHVAVSMPVMPKLAADLKGIYLLLFFRVSFALCWSLSSFNYSLQSFGRFTLSLSLSLSLLYYLTPYIGEYEFLNDAT